MINPGSPSSGPGPHPARMVRLLHGAILLGLLVIGVTFAALVGLGRGPLLGRIPNLAMTLSAVSAVLLVLILAVLRPRIPARPAEQSPDDYWGDAGTRGLAVLLWVTLEGSGVVGAVGHLLTGSTIPAVAAAAAILALFSVRPARLEA